MSYDYSNFENRALTLIDRFGRDVVLKRVSAGGYNPATGNFDDATEATVTVKAVATDYKLSQIDGTVVRRGDRMFLVAAKDITDPETNDLIDDWKVVDVETIETGDTKIFHRCQVRK